MGPEFAWLCAGRGDGVHVLTGPIYVCEAEPGDVLQVRLILTLLSERGLHLSAMQLWVLSHMDVPFAARHAHVDGS